MFIPSKPMNRRVLLRGVGAVALSLPVFEAMGPSLGQRTLAASTSLDEVPQRFIAMCAPLGFHAPFLFPDTEGDLVSTPYLDKLKDNHDKLTLLSGLSHPEQQGINGHSSDLTWLTSAMRPQLAGFRNSISLDQLIAQKIGTQTRYPSLVLANSGTPLSWTANGVNIPAITSPATLFKTLFIDGKEHEVQQELNRLSRGRSILDTVGGRAKRFEKTLGQGDRHKLAEYLSSVRDLELRLQESEAWVTRPKPKVDAEMPEDITEKADIINRQKLMYKMMALAIQSDSTRTITWQIGALNAPPKIEGVNSDWHQLSHHGKDPEKINELRIVEELELEAFNLFLTELRHTQENGTSLLDNTAVLLGSNLGNASAHDWHNLPIIVAGGGYKHGQYVAHDRDDNTPLANLFVELAQRMGVEIDRFGSSTAESVRGLEKAR